MKRSSRVGEYISTEDKIFDLEWKEIFDLKDVSEDYIAQGIIKYKDYIIFSVHEKGKRSVILFFKESKKGLSLVKEVVMPLEAVHTSDLTIYNDKLYALDFHSNFIYKFSLKEINGVMDLDLENKVKIFVEGKNFGSFSIIDKGDRVYLLATSFMNDNRIWVFDFYDLFEKQLGFEDSLIFETEGSFFTQGLYYNKKINKLFLSVNRFGKDFIFRMNIDSFLLNKDIKKSIEKVFLSPGRMVEDVYVGDNKIYTSDEETNKIYEADLGDAEEISLEKVFSLRKYKYYEKLLSHRNRILDFQENTLDGLTSILRTGIKYIEVDVILSADNKFFAYHDPFFKDGWKGFRFYDKTLHEIRRERYKDHKLRVTEFEDILNYFSKYKQVGQILSIDIKNFGEEEKLIDLIQEYNVLDAVEFYTWTPQIVLKLDELFRERRISRPIYFSHIRTDSIFRYMFIPQFLNWKKHFLVFGDFVLIGNHNYKTALGKYAQGFRHASCFVDLPEELVGILKKHNGGICVSVKSRRFPWLGKRYFEKMKKIGLKVSVFGPWFGELKINQKKWFENSAKDKNIDIVFMDDIDKML